MTDPCASRVLRARAKGYTSSTRVSCASCGAPVGYACEGATSPDLAPLMVLLPEVRRIADAHKANLLPTTEELDRMEEAVGRLVCGPFAEHMRIERRAARRCPGSGKPIAVRGAWQVPHCSVCPRVVQPGFLTGWAPEHEPPIGFAIAETFDQVLRSGGRN